MHKRRRLDKQICSDDTSNDEAKFEERKPEISAKMEAGSPKVQPRLDSDCDSDKQGEGQARQIMTQKDNLSEKSSEFDSDESYMKYNPAFWDEDQWKAMS